MYAGNIQYMIGTFGIHSRNIKGAITEHAATGAIEKASHELQNACMHCYFTKEPETWYWKHRTKHQNFHTRNESAVEAWTWALGNLCNVHQASKVTQLSHSPYFPDLSCLSAGLLKGTPLCLTSGSTLHLLPAQHNKSGDQFSLDGDWKKIQRLFPTLPLRCVFT